MDPARSGWHMLTAIEADMMGRGCRDQDWRSDKWYGKDGKSDFPIWLIDGCVSYAWNRGTNDDLHLVLKVKAKQSPEARNHNDNLYNILTLPFSASPISTLN